MNEPVADRPWMPGYGLKPASEGSGLLAWAEVQQRFAASHDYWVATTWPDGRPHLMPVWGVWDGSAFWFSSALRSRKIANLRHDPRCVVTGQDPLDPVVVEGSAQIVSGAGDLEAFLERVNQKYRTDYGAELVDSSANATVRVAPISAFALLAEDFGGSPTRWRFPQVRRATL